MFSSEKVNLSPSPDDMSGGKGKEKKAEILSEVSMVWKRYFRTEPPKPGSEAERRLKDYCERYIKLLLSEMNLNSGARQDHAKEMDFSSGRRRELHNQIAIMTLGGLRSNMSPELAAKVANFACELVSGFFNVEDYAKALEERKNGDTI